MIQKARPAHYGISVIFMQVEKETDMWQEKCTTKAVLLFYQYLHESVVVCLNIYHQSI